MNLELLQVAVVVGEPGRGSTEVNAVIHYSREVFWGQTVAQYIL